MPFEPRVIGGDPEDDAFPLVDAPPPMTRPAERLEAWPLTRPAIEKLERAAGEAMIATRTAGALLVERALLQRDFEQRALAHVIPLLDDAAAIARIERPLTEQSRVYLRRLVRPRCGDGRGVSSLALPMRLSERIGDIAAIESLVAPEHLSSALAWERAAVMAGRTMSEWAALEALELLG